MGIHRLADLIRAEAPDAVRSVALERYRGQVLALDASVALYQFRTAMPKIINRHGQNISPLQGLFYRTLHLLENGIKPVFVFDGKPPDLKQAVLAKRAAIARTARGAAGKGAHDSCPGSTRPEEPVSEDPPQWLPRRDSETLLTCLGVPYVQAPAEAEATCAALVKSGHASCTATEDLDALPFGSVRLLRHLNAKHGVLEEISLPAVLQKLGMTHEQFVDLCILLGCDYCEKIRGLGPKKALKLLQQHGSIEQILEGTSREKYPSPDNWRLEETRRLFLQPEVAEPSQVLLEWQEPDEEKLVQFLAHEKHMNETRVRRRMEKWRETRLKRAQPQRPVPEIRSGSRQQKMDEFFRVRKHPCRETKTPCGRKRQKCQQKTVMGT